LVVALAGATVTHIRAAVFLRALDLRPRNDWTSQRCPEQVYVLVDAVALDGGEAELFDKFALEVCDDHVECSDLLGLFFCGFKVFFLTDVGEEADYIVAFFEEPGEDAGGVETAGVGEADLFGRSQRSALRLL